VRWIARLAVLSLLAVVGLNLRDRQTVIADAGADLVVEREGIERAEGYVESLDARIDDAVARMRELDARVSTFEARNPDGIPAAEREDYDRLLGQRNEVVSEHNDLIARRRSAVQEYTERVGRHNARVESANAYAAQSTPWRIAQGLWASVIGGGND
jgi:beta-glucosidase-like glycosyl hydrolase